MPTLIDNVASWGGGVRVRFDFTPYMDGQAWSYTPGVDFTSKPVSFVQSARVAAKKYNKNVIAKVLKDGSAVLIQFVTPPPAQDTAAA